MKLKVGGLGLILLTIVILNTTGCRKNADFSTIDEIRVLQLSEVQGAVGHLIEFHIEKKNVSPADKVTSTVALLARDDDLTPDNFYIVITVVTERGDPRAAQILELFNLFAQATGLSIADLPDEETPPLVKMGSGSIGVIIARCLIIQTPAENVCLKLNLAIAKNLVDKMEKMVRDGPRSIDLGLTPEPPVVEPPVVEPPNPMTFAEEQAREKLRAWDEMIERRFKKVLYPPFDTPSDKLEWVASWISDEGLVSDFGFQFEETVLIDLLNLYLQERLEERPALRQTGVIVHPLSRNGLVYEYVKIQYEYPEENREGHLAHFRQSARRGEARVTRSEPTDVVPAGQELFWDPQWFPTRSFFTPVERTEWELKRADISIQDAIEENRRVGRNIPLEKTVSDISTTVTGVHHVFILTNLFYFYRLEQPAQAGAIEREGIIVHPRSRNGLVYKWLLLKYQYPDKTEAERITLFRESARRGEVVVNRETALTDVVPPGDVVMLFPPSESQHSPAERAAEALLKHYDRQVVNNGGRKEDPRIIFRLSDSREHDNYFSDIFKVENIEFVFATLWNICKAEQPVPAAAIEREGLIIHPISRNGMLYEYLRIRNEYPDETEAEWLTLFRQSARRGDVQVNRDGPTDIVPPEGTVRIRPPGENELVHQGLIVP